jgi:hypothetical protein
MSYSTPSQRSVLQVDLARYEEKIRGVPIDRPSPSTWGEDTSQVDPAQHNFGEFPSQVDPAQSIGEKTWRRHNTLADRPNPLPRGEDLESVLTGRPNPLLSTTWREDLERYINHMGYNPKVPGHQPNTTYQSVDKYHTQLSPSRSIVTEECLTKLQSSILPLNERGIPLQVYHGSTRTSTWQEAR